MVPYRSVTDAERLHALLDVVLQVDRDVDLRTVLHRVVDGARQLTGARYAALGVLDPSGTHLAEFVHAGLSAAQVAAIGELPQGRGVLGVLVVDPRPLRLDDLSTHPDAAGFPPGHPVMRSFLGLPVRAGGRVFGNLYLADKEDADAFSAEDEALVSALAAAAGAAIDKGRLMAQVADLTLVAERERVARDLHDTVIQRLFATGLSVEAAAGLVTDAGVRRRLEEAVAALDDTIRQVRTTIFELSEEPAGGPGVRAQVLAACSDAAAPLGFEPEVVFVGAVDATVPGLVAGDLLLAVREALANVARHARATRVAVEVVVERGPAPPPAVAGGRRRPTEAAASTAARGPSSDGARPAPPDGRSGELVPWLRLRVVDDGVGPPPSGPAPGRGLLRLAGRAQVHGGQLRMAAGTVGGTELRWEVPLPADPD